MRRHLTCLLAATLAGCASTDRLPPASTGSGAASAPPGMQYLYGSAEAAAISRQAYNVLVEAVRRRMASERADSRAQADRVQAILAPGASLAQPRFLPCGDRPRAVVLDIDETVLLNLGFEYDEAGHPGRPYDEARWARWEREGVAAVAPVPGAVAALNALRQMGVTVVFNTNRSAANAAFTEAALAGAGLGPARHGETLWLKGDLGSGSGKDSRREAIAARYCVVALVGDQLGDFSDLFVGGAAARRAQAALPAIAGLWGSFWFVLPNPVYGTALRGRIDDVFPAGKRWSPAMEK